MTTTTLYRIELPDTLCGPYGDTERNDRLADEEDLQAEVYYALFDPERDDWPDTHPHPLEDGLDRNLETLEQCAFASREQMNQWWTHEQQQTLLDAGYVFAVLEVHSDSVIHLGRQSIYSSGAVVRREHLTAVPAMV